MTAEGLRKLAVWLLGLAVVTPGLASGGQWAKMYGGSGMDIGALSETPSGDFHVHGLTTSLGAGQTDVLHAELNANGVVQGARTIGEAGNDLAAVWESGGNFLLAGQSDSFAGSQNLIWAKFDANWTPIFQKAFGGARTETAMFIPTSDNGLLAYGQSNSYGADSSDLDMLIVKIGPTGGIQWKKILDKSLADTATSAVETGDGGYLVAGTVTNPTNPMLLDLALVKLGSGGSILWQYLYSYSAGIVATPRIFRTADGFLLGAMLQPFTSPRPALLLVKVDAAGQIQWKKTFTSSTLAVNLSEVFEEPDNTLVVSGSLVNQATQKATVLIMKLEATGALVWQKQLGDSGHNTGGVFKAANGEILLSGMHAASLGSPDYDLLYGKLDTNYDLLWTRTFGGDLMDMGAVATSPGRYLLAGETTSFGAGAQSGDVFGATLDSNGDFAGCAFVNPITLTSTNPGLAVANAVLASSIPTFTARAGGGAFDINLTIQPVTINETEICAETGAIPQAPGSLKAAAQSSTTVALGWLDKSNDETGFKIERKNGGCGSTKPWAQIDTVGANVKNYTDSTLAASTTYSYQVRATNASGDSAYSNCISAKTATAGTPPAPSNLVAAATTVDKVKLTWADNSQDETSFKIFRITDGGTLTLLASKGANIVTHTDQTATGNNAAHAYSYAAQACNANGCSPSTMLAVVPHAPIDLIATSKSSTRIDLDWTDTSANESGFKVSRMEGACGATNPWKVIVSTKANEKTYSDRKVTAAKIYACKVRAFKKSTGPVYSFGYSLYTDCVQATTP